MSGLIDKDGNPILVPDNTISRRRGKIYLPANDVLINPTESRSRAVFSNFFPVAIIRHSIEINEHIEYHGFSPHFREVNEGEAIPKYQVVLMNNPVGETHFVEMKEVKQ